MGASLNLHETRVFARKKVGAPRLSDRDHGRIPRKGRDQGRQKGRRTTLQDPVFGLEMDSDFQNFPLRGQKVHRFAVKA